MLYDQFNVQRRLGRALYGDVWLCEDALHGNQLVAVKEVNLRQAKRALTANRHMDNPFDERRFAGYLAELPQRHENILRFRQEFLENGAWYMVTEYCEGGDLLGRLEMAPEGRLKESDALQYFRQVVRGVRFLHNNGIAHRDLSLENVLLRNGVCKIADFGLATEANRVCNERVGKAYYMAPEVIAEEDYDATAADMWSLGIMLFIMLTGSPLMPSASRQEKAFLAMEKFGVQKILEVWDMTSCISPAVVDLLSRLLQVSPAKRLTVEDIVEHPALSLV